MVKYSIAPKEIKRTTNIYKLRISRLKNKTRKKGYNLEKSKKLKLKYVTNSSRSKRPIKVILEVETEIIDFITYNRNLRKIYYNKITLYI